MCVYSRHTRCRMTARSPKTTELFQLWGVGFIWLKEDTHTWDLRVISGFLVNSYLPVYCTGRLAEPGSQVTPSKCHFLFHDYQESMEWLSQIHTTYTNFFPAFILPRGKSHTGCHHCFQGTVLGVFFPPCKHISSLYRNYRPDSQQTRVLLQPVSCSAALRDVKCRLQTSSFQGSPAPKRESNLPELLNAGSAANCRGLPSSPP